MKKKKIKINAKVIALFGIIAIIIGIVLIINEKKEIYYIKINRVDDYSPDRILEVYNDKNEKMKVKRIEYLDGTLLCNGYNTTVHFGEIEGEKELKILLEDNRKVTAQIKEEEVKN